jgi:ABC-type branched-subunit amino acid transport system substrate-binding protein
MGEGTYKRNTLSVRHALKEIESSHPEAIIIVGAYKPSAYFIRQARHCCRKETVFAPISFVNADALVDELGAETENILFSQTVPPYDDRTIKIARKFRSDLAHSYPGTQPTFAAFEGYLAARAVVAALRKNHGTPDRDTFLQTLRKLTRDDLDGLPVRYRKTQMLNRVYLMTFHKGAFHPVESGKVGR